MHKLVNVLSSEKDALNFAKKNFKPQKLPLRLQFFQDVQQAIGDELANCAIGPVLIDYLKLLTNYGQEFPGSNEYVQPGVQIFV